MRTIQVSVTKKNILNGRRQDGANCPIALALKAKGFSNIEVDDLLTRFKTKHGIYRYLANPSRATRFIRRFDAEKVVRPFVFKFKI